MLFHFFMFVFVQGVQSPNVDNQTPNSTKDILSMIREMIRDSVGQFYHLHRDESHNQGTLYSV